MNGKFLFNMCLILVALAGIGCASATDAFNNTPNENTIFSAEKNTEFIPYKTRINNTENRNYETKQFQM